MAWPPERSRHGGVDELPLPAGTPGRLWLCGKHFVGLDHDGAIEQVGATTVVCLVEPHEIDERYPAYAAWLRDNQPGRAVWHPIPDFHAPPLDRATALLDDLLARLDAGETVLLHCAGGFGRTGTIAAALLVRLGSTVDDALAAVAAARPMAGPEAGVQLDLLHALAGRP